MNMKPYFPDEQSSDSEHDQQNEMNLINSSVVPLDNLVIKKEE